MTRLSLAAKRIVQIAHDGIGCVPVGDLGGFACPSDEIIEQLSACGLGGQTDGGRRVGLAGGHVGLKHALTKSIAKIYGDWVVFLAAKLDHGGCCRFFGFGEILAKRHAGHCCRKHRNTELDHGQNPNEKLTCIAIEDQTSALTSMLKQDESVCDKVTQEHQYIHDQP